MYIVPHSFLCDHSHLRLQYRFCWHSQRSVLSKIVRICLSCWIHLGLVFLFWNISYWRPKRSFFSKNDLAVLQALDQQVGRLSSWETWSSNTRLRSRCNPRSYLGGAFNTVQVHRGAKSQTVYLGHLGCTDAVVREPVCNCRSSVISTAGLLGPDLACCVSGV